MFFRSESSTDGKVFKPVFIEGRMRKYSNLNNALNGAKQLLKNPKNKIILVRVISDTNDDQLATYVRKVGDVYETDLADKNKPENAFVKESNIVPVEVECVKKDKLSTSVDNLIEQVTQPIKELMSKEARIQFLKETHEKWKNKKKETIIVSDGSLNNLSTKNETDSLYTQIMSDLLKKAIEDKDINKFFKLEVSLSQRGYSWYPSEDDDIVVDHTSNVLELLNSKKM